LPNHVKGIITNPVKWGLYLDQLNKTVMTHSSHFHFIPILSSSVVIIILVIIVALIIAYKLERVQPSMAVAIPHGVLVRTWSLFLMLDPRMQMRVQTR